MKRVNNSNTQPVPYRRLLLMITIISFIPFGMIEAQNMDETILETARFQTPGYAANSLNVYNINGKITIEGYDGDEVRITAHKTIKARHHSHAKRGSEEVQLVVEELGDMVLVYIDAPFVSMEKRNGNFHYNMNRYDNDYEFQFDITINVPERADIRASTVNGTISLSDIKPDELTVSNVNGDIILDRISGTTKATTVNGRITATYTHSPSGDSEYKTVNGSIEVGYPADLSAEIRFQSLHGDLYTDFENIERMAPLVETGRRNRRGGTNWRVDRFAPIRIGSGGPEFQFNVINGDVYVKQIQS